MQKHLVVVFSRRSCRTILAWGPQTIYLFEGGVRGIIGGNRGCRGKRGDKGGEEETRGKGDKNLKAISESDSRSVFSS